MTDNQEKTKGLEFVNDQIPNVAKEFYDDKRIENVLNTGHTPTNQDFSLVEDMIDKLKKVMP